MTDARIPDRWLTDRRLLRLSPLDFRSFVMSLTWSVSNRTDGRIELADVGLIPGFSDDSITALEREELWCPVGMGWLIVDFEATQSSKVQLEGLDYKRHQDRERQARKRAHDAGDHRLCLPDNCKALSRDNPRDVTSDDRRDTEARQVQGEALSKGLPPQGDRELTHAERLRAAAMASFGDA